MKPRIFISAVSAEFHSIRDKVAHVIEFLGYEAERQEIFGTESDDLREMLQKKIDSCEGLIQIIGIGYGAEPPTVDPDVGRVSYTQFEFLYAKRKGKRTWLLFAGAECSRDKASDELDLPPDVSHPDPASYQAERQALQDAYREQIRSGGHIRWNFASDMELENAVLKLRNDSDELRREFQEWQQRIASGLTTLSNKIETEQKFSRATVLRAAAGICLLGAAGYWGISSLVRQQSSDVKAKLELLLEQSKVIAANRWSGLQGTDANLKYLALSKGSGFQIDQIKHLIQDGLSSSDPIVVAMAQYLAGEPAKALATTSEAIREEAANAQRPVSRLAELHTISALSNLAAGSDETALKEFEKAWMAYGVIGNHDDERDTMMIASAVLFCNGYVDNLMNACTIMSHALALGKTNLRHLDSYEVLFLFASPGIFSSEHKKGCLNLGPLGDDEKFVLTKTVTILGDRSPKNGVTTSPVGFLNLPVGILRHSAAFFRDAIQMVSTSKYLGEHHPYLLILYLNCTDIAWGLAEDQLMKEMASNLVRLSRYHYGRSETASLVRRILQTGEAQNTLRRLEEGGFIAKGDVKAELLGN